MRYQQLQLFTRPATAAMRDRTKARNYSPAKEEFRREHARRRRWGLARRHAQKLCRSRGCSCECAALGLHDDAEAAPPLIWPDEATCARRPQTAPRAEPARQAEAAAQAEPARQAEAAAQAEPARQAEAAALAEPARQAEAAALAEPARQAEAAAMTPPAHQMKVLPGPSRTPGEGRCPDPDAGRRRKPLPGPGPDAGRKPLPGPGSQAGHLRRRIRSEREHQFPAPTNLGEGARSWAVQSCVGKWRRGGCRQALASVLNWMPASFQPSGCSTHVWLARTVRAISWSRQIERLRWTYRMMIARS